MSLTNLSAPEFTDAELADLSRQFESWAASSVIEWAVENFAPHLALTASMTLRTYASWIAVTALLDSV